MTKYTLTAIITCLITGMVMAQSLELQTISSGGADLISPNGEKMNVVIGELAVEKLESNGFVLTQGFHQIFDVSTSVTDYQGEFSLTVFPNPTANYLNIDGTVEGNFQLTIYDLNGRIVQNTPYEGNRMEMNLTHLTDGTYFIRVSEDGKTIDQLKFQKL